MLLQLCNSQTDAAATAQVAWSVSGSGSGSQDAVATAEKDAATATHVVAGRSGDRGYIMLLMQPHL